MNDLPTTTRFKCSHVKDRAAPGIVFCSMKTIEGAPTRVIDLDTETELCAVCAARAIVLLHRLERGLAPLPDL